jgi:hypothetical protein
MSAKVVNSSINKRRNFLTLNIGSEQGVERDMAVMGSEGIIGRVTGRVEKLCQCDESTTQRFAGELSIKKRWKLWPLDLGFIRLSVLFVNRHSHPCSHQSRRHRHHQRTLGHFFRKA